MILINMILLVIYLLDNRNNILFAQGRFGLLESFKRHQRELQAVMRGASAEFHEFDKGKINIIAVR